MSSTKLFEISRLCFLLATCSALVIAYQNNRRTTYTQRISRSSRYPSSNKYSALISQRPLLHHSKSQLINRVPSSSLLSPLPGNRPFVGSYENRPTFSRPSQSLLRPNNRYSKQNRLKVTVPLEKLQLEEELQSSHAPQMTNFKTDEVTNTDYSDQDVADKTNSYTNSVQEPRQIVKPQKFQPYAFGYEADDGFGNKQYRHEKSTEPGSVRGSYGFLDSDGLYRHVDYVADHNGFRAKIRTSEPGTAQKSPASTIVESKPIYISPYSTTTRRPSTMYM